MAKILKPMKMTPASEIKYRRILLIGPSGIGKTTLFGTAHLDPRTGPMCVLDIDHSASALMGLADANGIEVERMEIDSWEDYNEVCEYLQAGESGFKSVLVDSMTETHIYSLMNIADMRIERALENENKKKDPDPYAIEQNDFGHSQNQLRRFIRTLRQLPMHVFATALVTTKSVPREGTVRLPALFGQMAEEVVGNFDTVWQYMRVQESTLNPKTKKSEEMITRKLILQAQPGIRAKTRYPFGFKGPEEMIVPDDPGYPIMTDLLNLLAVPIDKISE